MSSDIWMKMSFEIQVMIIFEMKPPCDADASKHILLNFDDKTFDTHSF